jgi:hypothetical protein
VQLRRRLAANLYAKDTRFVYELLQNAEDNGYSLAADPPWLHFAIHQDRIVIDSNEDGFSKANIKAICSISESTKTSVRGYIGERVSGSSRCSRLHTKFTFNPDRTHSHLNISGMEMAMTSGWSHR